MKRFALALFLLPTIAPAQTAQEACQQFGTIVQSQTMLTVTEILLVTNYANQISEQHPEAAELAQEMKRRYEAAASARLEAQTDSIEAMSAC